MTIKLTFKFNGEDLNKACNEFIEFCNKDVDEIENFFYMFSTVSDDEIISIKPHVNGEELQ